MSCTKSVRLFVGFGLCSPCHTVSVTYITSTIIWLRTDGTCSIWSDVDQIEATYREWQRWHCRTGRLRSNVLVDEVQTITTITPEHFFSGHGVLSQARYCHSLKSFRVIEVRINKAQSTAETKHQTSFFVLKSRCMRK